MTEGHDRGSDPMEVLPGPLPALSAGVFSGALIALPIALLDYSSLEAFATRGGIAMALLAAIAFTYSLLAVAFPVSSWLARQVGTTSVSASCTLLLIAQMLG